MSLTEALKAARALVAALEAAVDAEAMALMRSLDEEPDTTGIEPKGKPFTWDR